jgi:hypothetical protein
MGNGRCRLHGGKSTGPRTTAGLAKLAAARTTHGTQGAAKRATQRYVGALTVRTRLFCAAQRLRAYLTPALAARLATTPAEFMPPVHYAQIPVLEISDKTLCNGGRDARGRFMARPRPVPRGQAAEREAARAERQALAPWRAGIAQARLVKRAVLAGRRAARIAKCGEDPMEPRAVMPAVARDGTQVGVSAGMTLPERRGGRTVEVGRGAAGQKAAIGKIAQRPYGASVGARPEAARRVGHGAAGNAGTARAGLGAVAGGKAGIGEIVQRPYGTPDGARTDAARRVGHGAAGNAGMAAAGGGARGGGKAGIGKIAQRPYGASDGAWPDAATRAGHGRVGDAGAAAAGLGAAAGGTTAIGPGAQGPAATPDGVRRVVHGADGGHRSRVAAKLARVATLRAFRAAYAAQAGQRRGT